MLLPPVVFLRHAIRKSTSAWGMPLLFSAPSDILVFGLLDLMTLVVLGLTVGSSLTSGFTMVVVVLNPSEVKIY
jgi:hypothetical protein